VTSGFDAITAPDLPIRPEPQGVFCRCAQRAAARGARRGDTPPHRLHLLCLQEQRGAEGDAASTPRDFSGCGEFPALFPTRAMRSRRRALSASLSGARHGLAPDAEGPVRASHCVHLRGRRDRTGPDCPAYHPTDAPHGTLLIRQRLRVRRRRHTRLMRRRQHRDHDKAGALVWFPNPLRPWLFAAVGFRTADQGRSRSRWQVARAPSCPSGPLFPDRVLAASIPTATRTRSARVPLDHSGW
jgi:hypothetical protein